MMMRNVIWLLALISTSMLAACGQPSSELGDKSLESSNESLLATVNGEGITTAELDRLLARTFTARNLDQLDKSVRDKALESLIAAHAMQQAMEKTLSADKLSDIKLRAEAFEQELYVKEYLLLHAQPKPVESRRIQDYYDRNPQEFGGGERRVFEMLSTNKAPSESSRTAFLNQAPALKLELDWQAYAERASSDLVFQRADLIPGLLDKALEQAIGGLDVGEVSDVIYINGVPHAVKVVSVETLQPKPLSEVRARIRQKLGSEQLKESIKIASERAVQQAEIQRFPAQ